MNKQTGSAGVLWKNLIVSGLGIIAVLWLFSWYNGRNSQPTAIPVAPRQVQQDRETREPSSRLNPSEQASLKEFADGANSRDPLVREATLRNMDLVSKVRSIAAQAMRQNDLSDLKPDVLEVLRNRLKDDSPAVRLAAVEAVVPGYLDMWHTDPPFGLKPADAFAVGEALLTEKDLTIRLRAAIHLWVRSNSPSHSPTAGEMRITTTAGEVLIGIVKDAKATLADRILAAKVNNFYTPPRRPEGMVAALAGIIADSAAPLELRTTAVEAIKSSGDEVKRTLAAELRDKLHSSLTDNSLSGELRADILNLLGERQ